MLEVILVPFLLDRVTPHIPYPQSREVSGLLACSESKELIETHQGGQMDHKDEIIDTIKLNTEPGCYEGSEPNS